MGGVDRRGRGLLDRCCLKLLFRERLLEVYAADCELEGRSPGSEGHTDVAGPYTCALFYSFLVATPAPVAFTPASPGSSQICR